MSPEFQNEYPYVLEWNYLSDFTPEFLEQEYERLCELQRELGYSMIISRTAGGFELAFAILDEGKKFAQNAFKGEPESYGRIYKFVDVPPGYMQAWVDKVAKVMEIHGHNCTIKNMDDTAVVCFDNFDSHVVFIEAQESGYFDLLVQQNIDPKKVPAMDLS